MQNLFNKCITLYSREGKIITANLNRYEPLDTNSDK